MKKRKIGELNMPNISGWFTIYEEEGKTNPYSVYIEYYTRENDEQIGWRLKKHKRLIERYATFSSIMAHMTDMSLGNVYGRCFAEKGV